MVYLLTSDGEPGIREQPLTLHIYPGFDDHGLVSLSSGHVTLIESSVTVVGQNGTPSDTLLGRNYPWVTS